MKRILSLLVLGVGCHTPTSLPYHEQLVVRAYLYVGKPVTDIELTGTVSLSSADTIGPPIADASVALTKRGVRYALSADPSRAGYYGYAGTDLSVAAGDTFDLIVVWHDNTATARAIVPSPPVGLSLSSAQLDLSSSAFGSDSGIIIVRWSNPSADYFFAVVTPLDTSAGKIPTPGGGGIVTSGSVVFPPTQSDSTIIAPPQLHYYGRQRVDLYRVPPEYAALYIARQQDSRDLNEPPTNIHGGLGIFSAFAGDSAFFVAIGG